VLPTDDGSSLRIRKAATPDPDVQQFYRHLDIFLRLKALPEKSDIVLNALTVFGFQLAPDFLCPLGTFALRSSNVVADSQQSVQVGRSMNRPERLFGFNLQYFSREDRVRTDCLKNEAF
jgi:hypothetical protein